MRRPLGLIFGGKSRPFLLDPNSRPFRLPSVERLFVFHKGEAMSFVFQKQPGEKYTVAVDFSAPGALPDGVTISSCAATAYNAADGSSASSVLGTSGGVSGSRATVQVQAGTSGADYNIKLAITLSNSEILEEDLLMEVREQGR